MIIELFTAVAASRVPVKDGALLEMGTWLMKEPLDGVME